MTTLATINTIFFVVMSILCVASKIQSSRWQTVNTNRSTLLFPGTAGVSSASLATSLLRWRAGETPAVPGKSGTFLANRPHLNGTAEIQSSKIVEERRIEEQAIEPVE